MWGHATASDEVRLLGRLALPNTLLGGAARRYLLGLTPSVTSAQAWGVSAGVLPPATVALKNEWFIPTGESWWQVNSIGIVRGRGRFYLIAVLTSGDPSYADGVQTIEAISRALWSALAPARPHRR